MYYFAQLDSANIVRNIAILDDDANGETTLNQRTGKVWKRFYPDSSQRGKPAGIGDYFDEAKDKFIPAQPFDSWTLDSEDRWQPPVAMPTDEQSQLDETFEVEGQTLNYKYARQWDEVNQRWLGLDRSGNTHVWNPSDSTWSQI